MRVRRSESLGGGSPSDQQPGTPSRTPLLAAVGVASRDGTSCGPATGGGGGKHKHKNSWSTALPLLQDARAFTDSQAADGRDGGAVAELIKTHESTVQTALDSSGEPVNINYVVLGARVGAGAETDTRPRIMLIMGLAATLNGWKAQIIDMMDPPPGSTESPVVMCLLDNRGVGRSSSPAHLRDYTTAIMADDVAAVMDHIGWRTAHIVGFSMGGMIATKLAVRHTERILSLSILSSSTGGWDTIPRSWRAWKYVLRLSTDSSKETKAWVNLKFHFSKQTLRKWVAALNETRMHALHREYMSHGEPEKADAAADHACSPRLTPDAAGPDLDPEMGGLPPRPPSAASPARAVADLDGDGSTSAVPAPALNHGQDGSSGGPLAAARESPGRRAGRKGKQKAKKAAKKAAKGEDAGLKGQMHACWMHKVPRWERELIRAASFPKMCIHGRHDIIAPWSFGEKLAGFLGAKMVILEGAHFTPRECGHEVSLLLEGLILGQPRQKERENLDPERHMLPEGFEHTASIKLGPAVQPSPASATSTAATAGPESAISMMSGRTHVELVPVDTFQSSSVA